MLDTALTEVDGARFENLMKDTQRKVFNMAFRLAGNRTDAEDLTQEAYYRAYRSFSDYEGDRPFENWIFRIVTRLFLDMLRSRRRRIKYISYDTPLQGATDENLFFDKGDNSANPEDRLTKQTISEDLQRALNSLSPPQKVLVTLADIEGLSYKEMAEILSKPIGTIRSRLHRTHRILRSKLDKARREQKTNKLTTTASFVH
jgi:RNA polymerase sigma-70 factor (ECF subfamily)